jgi:thiol:disulfide interchange protein
VVFLSTFTDVLWWMLWAFLLAAYFYLLIVIFSDLWTNEWNGWLTALWTLFIFFMPLLGILAYMIFRPEPSPAEKAASYRQQSGISDAEELEKLAGLHDRGVLTDEEFAAQKARILA